MDGSCCSGVSVSARAHGDDFKKAEGSGFERQEGNGAGDGVRLHGRSEALKVEPQERIRHEIRPAGSGRTQKRHEVEKTWRRRPVERGKLDPRCAAALSRENAEGDETPRKGVVLETNGFGREWKARPLGKRRTL